MGLSPWSILQFQDDETGDCLLTRPIQFGLDSTAHQKNLFLMAASCAFICNLREVFPDILDWWWSLLGQSALTGESMPATKKPGDEVFSGSTCKQGEVCTPFLEKLLTWLIQPTMLAISRRFCHFLGATSSAIIFPLCFLCSLYVSFPYLGYASIVIKLSWDFAGPYGNWEFLHSFNCHRHYYRNYCYVRDPEAQLPWWNQQPISVAHWWHPYCYAHCAFCHHGHWFTQTLTTGSGFLLTHSYLCYSTRSILHVWARAHKPC